MNNDSTYRFLKWIALLGAVAMIGWMAYDHFSGMGPGDVDVIDGTSLFKDREYARSAEFFQRALRDKPDHVAAWHSLANSYVQLKRYDEALFAVNKAMKLNPDFGGFYATRGIIYDHLGKYDLAIADYERALKLYPEVAEGMHWIDRLLHNIPEPPPTVKERLAYLKAQMRLPPRQRRLRDPKFDDKQRPYEG